MLRRLLAHPRTAGLALDDPRTTELRRAIIREKPFLEAIYGEWYDAIARKLPAGRILELGSGAGFLEEHVPQAITSEVFLVSGVDLVLDGRALPFRERTLAALVLVDVLHHIPHPRAFFAEAIRVLRPGGRVIMLEPWLTPWSRLIYTHLHHEPFRPDAETWEFPSTGPLSGANGALPWILFHRDHETFRREFPTLRVISIEPTMPFRYLLSGGVSLRALAPAWSFTLFRALDRLLARPMGMFARIVLEKE